MSKYDDARQFIDGPSGFFNGEPDHDDVEKYFTPKMFQEMFSGDDDLPDDLDWEYVQRVAHDMIDERAADA